MKKILLIGAVIIIVGTGFIMFREKGTIIEDDFGIQSVSASYLDATYVIEDKSVTLVGGHAETTIPDSESVISTDFFGNEARGDLNGDGKEDIAFILTQSGGGTGVFFYAVVALKVENGYRGTNAVSLGDRIAPQTTEYRDGQIIVNYADRKPGEPFTTQPSMGISKYLKIDGHTLVEILK